MNKKILLAIGLPFVQLTLVGCGGQDQGSSEIGRDGNAGDHATLREDNVKAPDVAHASARAPHISLKVVGSGSHCVIPTVAEAKGESLGDAPINVTGNCFARFSDAMSFATRGSLILARDATPETLTEKDQAILTNPGAQAGGYASYVIGVEYEHANYGGSSLTYTSGVTCSGYTHWASSMPGGWNDVISSARAYSNCNNSWHYEHINFGGAVTNCYGACSYIGDAMNDRTSSIYWTQ